VQGW